MKFITQELKFIIIFVMLFASTSVMANSYLVSPGDRLEVSVFGNESLSTDVLIFDSGYINYPLLGELNVNGLSLREVEHLIAKKLKENNFVESAQVSINVIESKYKQVSVLGKVAKPGRYSFDGTSQNIIDFLALAGGVLEGGSSSVFIFKKSEGNYIKNIVNLDELFDENVIDNSKINSLRLAAGDIVYVPREPVFYIYGQINVPGSYSLLKEINVAQAISLGGGITSKGSDGSFVLKRINADGNLMEIEVKEDFTLRPSDIIYIKESLF